MIITCKNCGARHELKIITTLAEKTRRGTFQQVTNFPPLNPVSRFFWFMRGNKYQLPPPPNVVVRVENIVTPKKQLITELEIPATEAQVMELARLYCDRPGGLGFSWARKCTTRLTNFGQTFHNQITDSFRRLGFLEVGRGSEDNPTLYQLTDAGRRFLRHYLPPAPDGVYVENLDPVNKQ